METLSERDQEVHRIEEEIVRGVDRENRVSVEERTLIRWILLFVSCCCCGIASAQQTPKQPFCMAGWICLTPAGGGAGSDDAQIAVAFSDAANRPIMLTGAFDVCNSPQLPPSRVLTGPGNYGPDEANTGDQQTLPQTYIHCSGTVSGDGHGYSSLIRIADHDNVHNLAFYGGNSAGPDCIDAINANSFVIHDVYFKACNAAINQVSDSTDVGNWRSGAFAQESDIHNNIFELNTIAWYCHIVDTGGCTDNRFHDNEIEVPFYAGVLCGGGTHPSGCNHNSILNNRFEDGNTGIILFNTNQYLIVNGNFCNNLSYCIELDGGNAITIIGNRGQSNVTNSVCWALSGQQTLVTFQGNQCSYDGANAAYIYCPTVIIYSSGESCPGGPGSPVGPMLIDDLMGSPWAAAFADTTTTTNLTPFRRSTP